MKEERKLILKLGQMITDRVGVKVTVEDPEYWGLAEVLTDEMAEVCLSMKVRKPMTLEQIARKSGKDPERVQKLLDEMSVIGMIEYNWENADHHKQYVLPMFVPGCAEFMMMNDKQVEEHPILADFFENMSRLPLEKVTPMVPPGGSGIGMHVIPVEKAIPAKQESASVEHISHWLKKYQDKYAVGACSCRRQQRVRGEGCGEIEGDLCIGVGDMADYLVETGKGHYITQEEVLEILERAERNGFVHQITNIDGEDKIFAICNCAPGVCNALRTSQLFNTPNMSRSAYRAHVEAGKCVACGQCVEVCPVGAAKLGQKLCTKQGEISYPKSLLPDTEKWGPDKWAPDYRLIYAHDAENLTITGRGTLNGNGFKWWSWEKETRELIKKNGGKLPALNKLQRMWEEANEDLEISDYYKPSLERRMFRPPFIQFYECNNVLIENVKIVNSPFWTVNPEFCDNVTIKGITINNVPSPNTDGINPESCRNVHISDCHISVGDDCITIKSGRDAQARRLGVPCENITITNCTMLAGHGGVVIGSEMSGSVRKVTISNCVFDGTDRGIRIKSTRGRRSEERRVGKECRSRWSPYH